MNSHMTVFVVLLGAKVPTCFGPLGEFSQDRGSSRCFDIIFANLSKPVASSFAMLSLVCTVWNSVADDSQMRSHTAAAFRLGLVILSTEL